MQSLSEIFQVRRGWNGAGNIIVVPCRRVAQITLASSRKDEIQRLNAGCLWSVVSCKTNGQLFQDYRLWDTAIFLFIAINDKNSYTIILIIGIGMRIKGYQGYRSVGFSNRSQFRQGNGVVASHYDGNHAGFNQGAQIG
jgi:hypothetical protein